MCERESERNLKEGSNHESPLERAGKQAQDMIHLSIKAFTERDVFSAGKLKTMDNAVDEISELSQEGHEG